MLFVHLLGWRRPVGRRTNGTSLELPQSPVQNFWIYELNIDHGTTYRKLVV